MPKITSKIHIKAPIERVFDLARSITFHEFSTIQTGEKAIAGKTQGLIGMGESVTWKAKHFGVWQTLTSHITDFERPIFFADEMLEGIFESFRHEHHFLKDGNEAIMQDTFEYTAPLGALGRIADCLFLESYMTQLIQARNLIIKKALETNEWESFLDHEAN